MTSTTLLKQLRRQLRPTRSAESAVKLFLIQLQKKIPQAVVMAGGSYAKGTFIKGSHDIDVFVRFPKGTHDSDMSAAIAKALPKAVRLHGSRDYFQLKFKGFAFEIVPVQHITDWKEATNVTDMSPLHVAYVAKHLTDKQKDDVRLLKQFMKACGVYGAESYTRGFSGYVLELLVSIYGSFEILLKASAQWTESIVLDPAKHFGSAGEAIRRINESKLSPIILIDPLQPERNAAAALSSEAFNVFKKKASAFRKNPSKQYFDLTISQTKIKKEWPTQKIIFKKIKTPKGKHDIVGAKLRVKHDRAIALLKEHDFPLVHAEFRFGEKETLAWYVLTTTALSKIAERQGPPSSLPAAVESFKAIHADAYERNGRWYVKTKRKYTDAKKVIDAALARTR